VGGLRPEVKAKLNALLHEHPQDSLLVEKCPSGMDKDLYVFMRSATWPDMVRDGKNPLSKADNHAAWHYVNYPIELGGVHGTQPVIAWTSGADPDNALQALAKFRADLASASASAADKAKALSWTQHVVGDLHQPLHAVSLFSPDYPKGDKGGNSFWVNRDGKQVNLHSLWDQSLGTSTDVAAIAAQAKKLTETPALSRTALAGKLAKVTTDEDLAKESAALARTACYQEGKLMGVPGDKHNRPTGQAPALPEGYRHQMVELSKERVVLGGYRLADRLNQWVLTPPAVTTVPAPLH
jgi:hypothetical protein